MREDRRLARSGLEGRCRTRSSREHGQPRETKADLIGPLCDGVWHHRRRSRGRKNNSHLREQNQQRAAEAGGASEQRRTAAARPDSVLRAEGVMSEVHDYNSGPAIIVLDTQHPQA